MGDIADMMLEGILCEGCGCTMPGKAEGFPRRCKYCKTTQNDPHPSEHVPCKVCRRMVKFCGLNDHMYAVHGTPRKSKTP